ncbi:hypothetical protein WJX82_003367 [Trebouxia sp. C0006]
MDEDRLQGLREELRPCAQHPDSDDEAELLRLQSEFVSGQQRPAAKATRIVRKAEACAPPASKPATPNEQPTTNQCSTTSDDFSGLLPGMLGILTNVQEKPALGHVAPPSTPAGGAAFPKAMHRKLSKFALSRQQPEAPQTPGHAPRANSNSVASVDADIVGRLRFSLEGQVVGLKGVAGATKGPGDDQQVVQRDILRQSEGSSPQGYTLQEACLLARSSLTKQRVVALRILAAVLAAARPQASHQQAAGVLMPQPVNLPVHLSIHDNMVARMTWLLVWEYALQEVQVATVLRRLLDDAHMSVVTAAAEAMAVLVGPGPKEEEVWEAAHCNPGTGCPSVPWRYCARPHPVGAWVTTPVDRDGPEPPGPGLVEEQPPDDGRVAIVDPLIGLLGMQVLERISFLLRSPAALSATTPLLVILQSYIRAGADAARAVWQCPGMQKALQGLIQGPAGSLPSDRAAELSASALSIVRMLASSDSQLFTAVMSSGLLMHAQRALAVATTSSSSIGDQLQHLNLQVEALHVWRLCADHNELFMHLDDAYAAICRLFSPPSFAPSTPGHTDDDDHVSDHMDGHVGVPHGSRAAASKAALLHKLQLQASCHAFLLLGSLVGHANRNPDKAMLSPGSATALVNDALEWIQSPVLHMLPKGIINALSGQVLTSHTAQAGLVEIQPWTATWFQQQMPHSKLLLHALEHLNVSSLKAGDAQQVFQTALALPAALPPGAEALALRALSRRNATDRTASSSAIWLSSTSA